MKKIIERFILVGVLASLFSFTNPVDNVVGIYSVTDDNPNKIELILNSDQTFSYKDFSNTAKIIDVTGNWEIKNGSILLKDYEQGVSFHNKWKITDDGNTVKSRKGLTFYRLMKRMSE